MLVKTMDYLDHFARFKRKENVEAVERLLSAHQELAKFERAQLGKSALSPIPPSMMPKSSTIQLACVLHRNHSPASYVHGPNRHTREEALI